MIATYIVALFLKILFSKSLTANFLKSFSFKKLLVYGIGSML